MKKYILVLSLIFTLAGCAWIGQQVDYAKLCQQDAVCLSKAKSDSALVSSVVSVAYPIAAAPVGAAIFALALWFRGKKLVKKDEK